MSRPKKPPYAACPTDKSDSRYGEKLAAWMKYEAYKRALKRGDFTSYNETYTRDREIRGGEGDIPEDRPFTYTARVEYIDGTQGTEKAQGIDAADRAEAIQKGRDEVLDREHPEHGEVNDIIEERANRTRGEGFKKGSDPRRHRDKGEDQEGEADQQESEGDESEGQDQSGDESENGSASPENESDGGSDSQGQQGGESGPQGQGEPPDPTLRDLAKQLQSAMDQAAQGQSGSSRMPKNPDLIILRKNEAPYEGMEALIALSEIAVGSLEPAIEILQKAVLEAAKTGKMDEAAVRNVVEKLLGDARLDLDKTFMSDGKTLRQAIEDMTITKSIEDLVKEVSKRLQQPDTVINVVEPDATAEFNAEGKVTTAAPRKIKDKYNLGRVVHPQCDQVVELLLENLPVAMVGPTGCGKSVLARDAAEVWSLVEGTQEAKDAYARFGSASVTGGMSEAGLIGRLAPIGKGGAFEYMPAQFATNYEEGGPFVLDEGDAADPNVMLVINEAMANGHLPLPSRVANPQAKRHPYFRIITNWNTWGTGANRMFVGRNQLDGATLDRFLIGTVEMDYSRDLERQLVADQDFLGWCWKMRDQMNDARLRRNLSTRFIVQSYHMVCKRGWDIKKVYTRLTSGWSQDELSKVAS